MRRRRRHSRARGSALTELVVVVPLFIAIIYGTLYLADLGTLRLRPQEIARYGAFAFAARPLSAYDADKLNSAAHERRFQEARDSVQSELYGVYHDLSATDLGTVAAMYTLTGSYVLPIDGNFKNQRVQVVPDFADLQWSEPLSALGFVLQLLQIGTGINSAIANMTNRMTMNAKGQITARAVVKALPPVRSGAAAVRKNAMRIGASRHADLSALDYAEKEIKETRRDRIELTLIADPWRVTSGVAALPDGAGGASTNRGYGNAVTEVARRGFEVIPLGNVLAYLLRAFDAVPDTVAKATGWAKGPAAAHLVSLPYVRERDLRFSAHLRGATEVGQVDLFALTGGEAGDEAVTNFDTLPMFTDPMRENQRLGVELVNRRGQNFMGCRDAQERGCWE